MGCWDKMLVSSKICILTPMPRLVLQDIVAVLWEEHNRSDTTRGNVIFPHLRSADMRGEGGDLVENHAGVEYANCPWLITSS